MFTSKSDRNLMMPPGTPTEMREAAEHEQQRRAAERKKLIVAQSSPRYDSQQRIKLWEHIHGMHLPRDAGHRLVRVIAEQTDLTVEQVQQEQIRRASVAAPTATAPSP